MKCPDCEQSLTFKKEEHEGDLHLRYFFCKTCGVFWRHEFDGYEQTSSLIQVGDLE